jgi:hypothetical protein
MSGSTKTVPAVKGLSTLVRPKFGPGMLLQHEDLEQLHGYTRELNRLLFRSLFGCGVVCGLVVKTGDDNCGQAQIVVGAGLALNCSGDPIHVPKDQPLVFDPHRDKGMKGPLWVIVCPTVKGCAPRPSMCAADDDETSSSCTRERDGYEIRVVGERPRCSCGCLPSEEREKSEYVVEGERERTRESDCWCVDPKDPCYADHYLGKCGCPRGDCSGGGCDCVLLARLDLTGDPAKWEADHSVRRFIRPVLMRDPQVAEEIKAASAKNGQKYRS